MENQKVSKEMLGTINDLLSASKRVMNVSDLSRYTGLSKSKIYKLIQLNLIPTGTNPYVRQKFFEKDAIDDWLLGKNRTSYPGDHQNRHYSNSKD